MSNLALRVASSAVLAPVALAIAYVDGWPFLALCAIAACGILREWAMLVTGRASPQILAPGLAALLVAAVLIGVNEPRAALAAIALGALAAAAGASLFSGAADGGPAARAALWAAVGVIYAGAALAAPALLRRDDERGFAAILFLTAVVWITDSCAYFAGKAIGGPLLWPRVSPNKTWAGAIGGVGGGVVAGIAVAYASGVGRLVVAGIIALVLSVVAEFGDLFESAVKRRFGAKDTGRIIPGHGGLMDRLDGLTAAAFAGLLIGLVRQGMDAPARGLLVW